MTPKRMVSARIPEPLAQLVERLTPGKGERTAFHEQALAREALRRSGRPITASSHPGDEAGDGGGKGEPGPSS